jgi:hypothetical protein
MATKKKPEEYKSKAVTTRIVAVSRASKQIDGSYYTLEYSEERTLPEDANLVEERKLLWDTVNGEVDQMMVDTYNMIMSEKERYKNKKK